MKTCLKATQIVRMKDFTYSGKIVKRHTLHIR